MSRTRKRTKSPGYDFRSVTAALSTKAAARPEAKRITKQQERTRTARLERIAMERPDEVEDRFPGE